MASVIYLGALYPQQSDFEGYDWGYKYTSPVAIIAKGNIIEGIKAKY